MTARRQNGGAYTKSSLVGDFILTRLSIIVQAAFLRD